MAAIRCKLKHRKSQLVLLVVTKCRLRQKNRHQVVHSAATRCNPSHKNQRAVLLAAIRCNLSRTNQLAHLVATRCNLNKQSLRVHLVATKCNLPRMSQLVHLVATRCNLRKTSQLVHLAATRCRLNSRSHQLVLSVGTRCKRNRKSSSEQAARLHQQLRNPVTYSAQIVVVRLIELLPPQQLRMGHSANRHSRHLAPAGAIECKRRLPQRRQSFKRKRSRL